MTDENFGTATVIKENPDGAGVFGETLRIDVKEGEFWYGGLIDDTGNMPYTAKTRVRFDAVANHAYNQVNPLLLSSEGRYVYAPDYFVMEIADGRIELRSPRRMDFGQKDNFRAAYEYINDKYFAFDGRCPAEELFAKPQYCTWMALNYHHTRQGVLDFAEGILDAGLPAGELIIDDGWSDYYGQLDFSSSRFPSPESMCAKLREMGFFVSLWVCPYISADSPVFHELDKKGFLLRKNGEPYICHWWKGYSACLDFSHPAARAWFKEKIGRLFDRYGVSGVKLDGGDARIYENTPQSYGGGSANDLSEAYGRFAAEFSVSELRATAKCGGLPVIQRVSDRYHAWEDVKNGFDGIVKKSLIMGLSGYPYNCPDMIGGGQVEDVERGVQEDEELNIRFMQAATFMPSLQFSKPLWKQGERLRRQVLDMLALREKYLPYLISRVRACAKTGEPIIAPMLYEYGVLPGDTEQFAVGRELIVAPVTVKGAREKRAYLPAGKWRYADGKTYEGGGYVVVPAPLETLPYFVRL